MLTIPLLRHRIGEFVQFDHNTAFDLALAIFNIATLALFALNMLPRNVPTELQRVVSYYCRLPFASTTPLIHRKQRTTVHSPCIYPASHFAQNALHRQAPARAASIAAFSAKIFVWNAMPSITPMMSAIFSNDAVIELIVSTTCENAAPPLTASARPAVPRTHTVE